MALDRRPLGRVHTLFHEAETQALDGELTLLPTAEASSASLGGAGDTAPSSFEFDGVVAAHVEKLRAWMQNLVQRVAMAVDEEWTALNWSQEMPPVAETEESRERRMAQTQMEQYPLLYHHLN